MNPYVKQIYKHPKYSKNQLRFKKFIIKWTSLFLPFMPMMKVNFKNFSGNEQVIKEFMNDDLVYKEMMSARTLDSAIKIVKRLKWILKGID